MGEMQTNLVNFIQVLRSHDIRVSPAETLDAMEVAANLGYGNRIRLRDGLSMALAKTPAEELVFDRCFDRYFTVELADFSSKPDDHHSADESADSETSEQAAEDESNATANDEDLLTEAAAQAPQLDALMQSELMQNLLSNDRNALSLAMTRAGDSVGLQQIQMFTQRGQFTRKILDQLGEQHIRQAVIELEQLNSPALAELQRYRDILREQVRDYVEREYLLHAEGRNRQFMEEILSKTRLNNIERHYLGRVHELIQKMARKLAARYSRKQRSTKRGQLNMGRTLRSSAATDGVLFNTHWRKTRRKKPEIIAICDVSGSVAAYAKFLLMFLYSIQDVLPKVRSFAFSSHMGEVSDLFKEHELEKAIELVNWKYGGATDYGGSFEDFATLALDDIGSSTTVIILGDARNNGGDPKLEIMQSIYQRSKQVIWLNPESRRAWGTGDSEMLRYQTTCHLTAECNNLKQLERIIDQLLKSTR